MKYDLDRSGARPNNVAHDLRSLSLAGGNVPVHPNCRNIVFGRDAKIYSRMYTINRTTTAKR